MDLLHQLVDSVGSLQTSMTSVNCNLDALNNEFNARNQWVDSQFQAVSEAFGDWEYNDIEQVDVPLSGQERDPSLLQSEAPCQGLAENSTSVPDPRACGPGFQSVVPSSLDSIASQAQGVSNWLPFPDDWILRIIKGKPTVVKVTTQQDGSLSCCEVPDVQYKWDDDKGHVYKSNPLQSVSKPASANIPPSTKQLQEALYVVA